ncbi:MAG TPA: NAD-dependent epimerase/dehydratase family protein, partial [Acidobacteriaceae bacterium]|nr:NAD-dependent epimerase/dehydratase family protein [Acidobacteriaceae bacterium]
MSEADEQAELHRQFTGWRSREMECGSMRVLLFGGTGMVGQGVLRECLLDPEVELVQTIGRSATGKQHARLKEIVHQDLFHYEAMESELAGYDACFFCLGVSSAGMSEEDYFHLTFELTITAAATLARLNPQMTFLYISGAGTDTSEHGRSMWARVKGK